MLKNKTIRWLLALNVLVVLGLGTRWALSSRAEKMARSQDEQRYDAESQARGILRDTDQRRVHDIERAIASRHAVTDAELSELLQVPDHNLAGTAATRDLATMSALGAMVKVDHFTPEQTAQLVPFVRDRLNEAERAPTGAMVAMGLALKLDDKRAMDRVQELTKSPLPPIAELARKLLKKKQANVR